MSLVPCANSSTSRTGEVAGTERVRHQRPYDRGVTTTRDTMGDVTGEAIAVDVQLELRPETDARAPGGEVTRELCGAWDHEGPCRWPHFSEIDAETAPARLRTIVAVSADERDVVVRRIEKALRDDDRWHILQFDTRPVADDERSIAEHLSQT